MMALAIIGLVLPGIVIGLTLPLVFPGILPTMVETRVKVVSYPIKGFPYGDIPPYEVDDRVDPYGDTLVRDHQVTRVVRPC